MTTRPRMKLGLVGEQREGSVGGRTPRFGDMRTLARTAEAVGLDSFWLADHFFFNPPGQEKIGGWEVFTMLSALAATTSRITLGPLVACTTFRNPALLARMADTLDEISGGRFILTLGAGWYEAEYRTFGYPFDHRAARFEEALQIIVPLLREGQVEFSGRYYRAHDAFSRPRGPSGSRLPIWIGARRPRMLRSVARYADAWNTVWHSRAAGVSAVYPGLLEARAAVGRDPATIELTAGTEVHVLEPGEHAVAGDMHISGSPEEVAEALSEFAAVGVQHLVCTIEPYDAAHIERFGRVIELLDHD